MRGGIRGRSKSKGFATDGQPQPLESDPTAALACQLESNPLYELEIAAFFRAGAFGSMLPRDRAQDGLFTMQPVWDRENGQAPSFMGIWVNENHAGTA